MTVTEQYEALAKEFSTGSVICDDNLGYNVRVFSRFRFDEQGCRRFIAEAQAELQADGVSWDVLTGLQPNGVWVMVCAGRAAKSE